MFLSSGNRGSNYAPPKITPETFPPFLFFYVSYSVRNSASFLLYAASNDTRILRRSLKALVTMQEDITFYGSKIAPNRWTILRSRWYYTAPSYTEEENNRKNGRFHKCVLEDALLLFFRKFSTPHVRI